MSVTLRPAKSGDLAALKTREQEVFAGESWSESMLAAELADELADAVVAEVDGHVVGYATSRVVGDLADLTRVAVRADHRRTGVGRALVREAARDATTKGANRMLLEVSAANEAALKFYAAEGFVEIDRRPRYYRDGSDALVLRLALGPGCGGG